MVVSMVNEHVDSCVALASTQFMFPFVSQNKRSFVLVKILQIDHLRDSNSSSSRVSITAFTLRLNSLFDLAKIA